MVADFRSPRWAKQDLLKSGLDNSVLNEVLPKGYATTTKMIAQYIYDKTKKRSPSNMKLKVSVSETPNSWAEDKDK